MKDGREWGGKSNAAYPPTTKLSAVYMWCSIGMLVVSTLAGPDTVHEQPDEFMPTVPADRAVDSNAITS